jgi:hypothetical protein
MNNSNIRCIAGKTLIIILIINICFSLKAQTNSNSSPQFLYSDFKIGIVKLKNGTNQSIALNYNTVSEKMVFVKDGNLYDMMNPEQIDTVFLQDCKFIPVGNIYYQVLLVAQISLFVQYKGSIIPPGTPAGYGGTSQTSSTKLLSSVQLSSGYYNLKLPTDYDVKVDPVYWIRKNNEKLSFMNERQFLKIFPGAESELKQFIKQNKIKFDRLPDLVRLISHCNDSFR